jgi:hypothetical protein
MRDYYAALVLPALLIVGLILATGVVLGIVWRIAAFVAGV